jgi:hypothetical protein
MSKRHGRIRSFQYVDFWLYVIAAGTFIQSMWKPIFQKEYQGLNSVIYELSYIKSYTAQYNSEDSYIEYTAVALIIFAILVYVRNYYVMNQIDNRDERTGIDFSFLDYNGRIAFTAERLLRSLMILWILCSTISEVRIVTFPIQAISTFIVTRIPKKTDQLNIEPEQLLLTYYGTALAILFLLFFMWDAVNVFSIEYRLRKKATTELSEGNEIECSEQFEPVDWRFLIPDNYKENRSVYSFIAYIKPTTPSSDKKSALPNISCKRLVEKNRFILLYFLSEKFRERFFGFFLSAFIAVTPLLSDFDQIILILTTFFLMGGYLISVFRETIKAISSIAYTLVAYFHHHQLELEIKR